MWLVAQFWGDDVMWKQPDLDLIWARERKWKTKNVWACVPLHYVSLCLINVHVHVWIYTHMCMHVWCVSMSLCARCFCWQWQWNKDFVLYMWSAHSSHVILCISHVICMFFTSISDVICMFLTRQLKLIITLAWCKGSWWNEAIDKWGGEASQIAMCFVCMYLTCKHVGDESTWSSTLQIDSVLPSGNKHCNLVAKGESDTSKCC